MLCFKHHHSEFSHKQTNSGIAAFFFSFFCLPKRSVTRQWNVKKSRLTASGWGSSQVPLQNTKLQFMMNKGQRIRIFSCSSHSGLPQRGKNENVSLKVKTERNVLNIVKRDGAESLTQQGWGRSCIFAYWQYWCYVTTLDSSQLMEVAVVTVVMVVLNQLTPCPARDVSLLLD